MNALKHGMTARIPVLPGEDPEVFRQHVEGIVASLTPRSPLELALAEQAALSLWKIERAERVEAARAEAALREAKARAETSRQEELHALGRWLLAKSVQAKREAADDLLAFLPEERHAPFQAGRGEPLVILLRIQATANGCRWLLWRWDRLRDRLGQEGGWDIEAMIEAAQLRGERPLLLETADWEGLLQERYASNTAYLEEGRRQLLDQLTEGEAADPASAAAALRRLVEEETTRLEELKAAHEDREAADRCELADRLAVDATPEGERVRRYQLDCDRKLHRAIQGLLKLRRANGVAAEPDAEGVPGPAGPFVPPNGLVPAAADVAVTVPMPHGAVEPPDGLAPLARDVPLTASGAVEPESGLVPTATDLPAVATATAGAIEPDDGGAGAGEAAQGGRVLSAAAGADREPVLANEPRPHTGSELIRRNEPGPAIGGDRRPPNEPTESGGIAPLRSDDTASADDGPPRPPRTCARPGCGTASGPPDRPHDRHPPHHPVDPTKKAG